MVIKRLIDYILGVSRPVNADAGATRKRILESALEAFADHGPSGGSVRGIAQNAGVSVAMIHHYFGSKDELYVACIDNLYRDLLAMWNRIESAYFNNMPIEATLDRVIRLGFRFAREHQTPSRMLLRQIIEGGETETKRREIIQRPFLTYTSERLGKVMGRPPEELRMAIQSIVMLISRYALGHDEELQVVAGPPRDENDKTALERTEDHLVEVARAILGVQPTMD